LLLREQRPGKGKRMGDQQIGTGARALQVVVALLEVRHEQLAHHQFGSAPRVDQPRHHFRLVPEAAHVGAHRREADAGGLDSIAVLGERGDRRSVAAALELLRDGDVRMDVAERAESGEDDLQVRRERRAGKAPGIIRRAGPRTLSSGTIPERYCLFTQEVLNA
jgi:hypothetical protein